jgi:hypothetical protein
MHYAQRSGDRSRVIVCAGMRSRCRLVGRSSRVGIPDLTLGTPAGLIGGTLFQGGGADRAPPVAGGRWRIEIFLGLCRLAEIQG